MMSIYKDKYKTFFVKEEKINNKNKKKVKNIQNNQNLIEFKESFKQVKKII